jgi:hypothetical protein
MILLTAIYSYCTYVLLLVIDQWSRRKGDGEFGYSYAK